MSIKDISTEEIVKELLQRMGTDTCVEIEVGKIIQIGYYPNHVDGARYIVCAESHPPVSSISFEEVYKIFSDLCEA